MGKMAALGLVLIALGVVMLAGYGIYLFLLASEIPAVIRLGVMVLVAGVFVLLFSLVLERLSDLKKEGAEKKRR